MADSRNKKFFWSDHPPAPQAGITAQKWAKIEVKWSKNRVLQEVLNEVALDPPHGLGKFCGITWRIRGTKIFSKIGVNSIRIG